MDDQIQQQQASDVNTTTQTPQPVTTPVGTSRAARRQSNTSKASAPEQNTEKPQEPVSDSEPVIPNAQDEKSSQEDSPIPAATRAKYASLEKKNAELEKKVKDYDTLNTQNQSLTMVLNDIEEEILKTDKSAFEKLAKRFKTKYNVDLSYDQIYAIQQNAKAEEKAQSDKANIKSENVSLSAADVEQIAEKKAKEYTNRNMEIQNSLNYFLKTIPEFDYTDEEKKSIEQKNPAESVLAKEKKFDEVMAPLRENPGLEQFYKNKYGWDLGRIMVHLYNSLPENQDKKIERAKADGEIAGRQNALKAGVGVTTNMSSQQGSNTSKTVDLNKLTSSQKDRYNFLAKTSEDNAFRYYETSVRYNNGRGIAVRRR